MAAQHRAGNGTPASTTWTKEMVEKLILVFNDTSRVDPQDARGILELIGKFEQFERIVEAGGVEPGDAQALAQQFLRFGREWIQKYRAQHKPAGRMWTKEMVEKLVLYFNDPKISDKDERAMKDLVQKFLLFEAIVAKGGVEPGEPDQLARAFLKLGREWLGKNPKYAKLYQGASGGAAA